MPRSIDAVLAPVAASQWGMFTAAQAQASGVARSTLLRREQAGTLERVRMGVYRHAGAPSSHLDDIRAAWLASDPSTPAWERLDDPDVVVGSSAAAWVHSIGDLYPSLVLLYTRARRQSKQDDIKYSTRRLSPEDVTAVGGLPVTTRERTIADLLNAPGSDLSLVADALRDAERADADLDTDRLVALLGPHAKRLGHGSGVELYELLRSMTHVDEERARNLLAHTNLPALVESLAVDHTETVLRSLLESVTADQAKVIMTALRGTLLVDLNTQVKDAIMPLKGEGIRWNSIVTPQIKLPANLLKTALANIKVPTITPEVQKHISDLAKAATIAVPKPTLPKIAAPKTSPLPAPVLPPMRPQFLNEAARRATRPSQRGASPSHPKPEEAG